VSEGSAQGEVNVAGPVAAVVLKPDLTGWPTFPPLPDVTDLSAKAMLSIMMRAMFGAPPAVSQASQKAHLLFINLVRLTDKTLNEYTAAKVQIEDFEAHKEDGRFSPLFRAIDHFENCIGALHRALLYVTALGGRREVAPIDRVSLRYLKGPTKRVNDMRDAIEHTDEDILGGRLVEGTARYLWPVAEGITLAGMLITYRELTTWMRHLHGVTTTLLSGDGEDG
jgi:hypothetical protein